MGRPIDLDKQYDPAFPRLLVEHMAKGLDFACFGGRPDILVGETRLREWLDQYPDFAKAQKVGKTASSYWWQTKGMKAKNISDTKWIFSIKNKHGWVDVKKIDAMIRGEIAHKVEKFSIEKLREAVKLDPFIETIVTEQEDTKLIEAKKLDPFTEEDE